MLENCGESKAQCHVAELAHELKICRKELKNLRESISNLKRMHQKDVKKLVSLSEDSTAPTIHKLQNSANEKFELSLQPIGYIESLFKAKNAIPHQSSVCPLSRSRLKIQKSIFTNPQHSLIGLEQYSHIWLIFIFHKNQQNGKEKSFTKAKIQPPRLNGKTLGVFATRSPHRPNPVGLTLSRLEKIEGDILYLSGVDLLDGTPVIDIKPYIPKYDVPRLILVKDKSEILTLEDDQYDNDTIYQHDNTNSCTTKDKLTNNKVHQNSFQLTANSGNYETERESNSDYLKKNQQHTLFSSEYSSEMSVRVASWITHPVLSKLAVVFSNRAEADLKKFHAKGTHKEECIFCLEFLYSTEDCIQIICQLLQTDPRSIYRRKKCCDKLYYFTVDKLHITAWFDDKENIAEVLRVTAQIDEKY